MTLLTVLILCPDCAIHHPVRSWVYSHREDAEADARAILAMVASHGYTPDAFAVNIRDAFEMDTGGGKRQWLN